MKAEKITFIVLGLMLIIGFSYYQLKDETFNLPFKNPLQKKSVDLKEFYIDISEGDTEVEKTAIIKYNNFLLEAEKIYNKKLSGKEINLEESNRFYAFRDDFSSYTDKNTMNIQDKLIQNILTKLKDSGKYLNSLPFANEINAESKESIEKKREKVDTNKTEVTSIEPVDQYKTNDSQEIEVDLNDYLGHHGDGTDWNYTEFGDETVEYLKDKGIYYSHKLNSWARVKK